jgi:hypothetical protein
MVDMSCVSPTSAVYKRRTGRTASSRLHFPLSWLVNISTRERREISLDDYIIPGYPLYEH